MSGSRRVGDPRSARRLAEQALGAPNKKGAPTSQSAFWKTKNYFAPRMASLAALATWNFTTRLAGI